MVSYLVRYQQLLELEEGYPYYSRKNMAEINTKMVSSNLDISSYWNLKRGIRFIAEKIMAEINMIQ